MEFAEKLCIQTFSHNIFITYWVIIVNISLQIYKILFKINSQDGRKFVFRLPY